MKKVLSVSLGSSSRDSKAIVEIAGETISVERIGVDGDIGKAMQTISQYDGKVDAFGLGGLIFTLLVVGSAICLKSQPELHP